jgi:hypothetical protein
MSPKQNENESLMQAYQQTLLMTDARIIAENDDSIVVAVKISKEFIRRTTDCFSRYRSVSGDRQQGRATRPAFLREGWGDLAVGARVPPSQPFAGSQGARS